MIFRMIPIFRHGKIYNYDTTYGDRSWSLGEYYQAASFYATCMVKGYSESMCYSLSYMYVSLKREPELCYESNYTKTIQQIMDHVEKA